VLSVLNALCHGYVATPLLALSARRRLLDQLHRDRAVSLASLVENTNANAGYLEILLHALQSLGWVERTGGGYLIGLGAQPDRLCCEVVELYNFTPRELLADETARIVLLREIARLVNERGGDERPGQIARLLEGAVLLPLLIGLKALQTEPASAPLSDLPDQLQEALRLFFRLKGWLQPHSDVELTLLGREIFERVSVMAIAGSYRAMLAGVDSLIFGNPSHVIDRSGKVEEIHVDRTMNVVASGYQHRRYFKEAEAPLLEIFGHSKFDVQPKYIADMGCGDGTFLRLAYDFIRERTVRGTRLREYPLTLIGVDCSPAALQETTKTLANYPHIAMLGDVGRPHQLLDDLRAHGIERPQEILHVRSFLDHDFRYERAQRLRASADAHRPADAAYVDQSGNSLPIEDVLAAWRANLKRWSEVISPHGMLVLEAHCLPPRCTRQNFSATESFYFDTLHALSQQYLISADSFLTTAASDGLFPRVPCTRFPKTLPFCRITLTHFEKRDYLVRTAETSDLPALYELEDLCWPDKLRAPVVAIAERLRIHPSGQFVLEVDGKVVAVLYTQRTATVGDIAMSTAADTGLLHMDAGPVVQLIALNVAPDWQDKRLGDQLLEFVLQVCALTNDVRAVAGVTRCKSYDVRSHGPIEEYIKARDQRGKLLDPILHYHESHGAKILEVVPNYRPLDTENNGCGVLIRYDIRSSRRSAQERVPASSHHEPEAPGTNVEAQTEYIIRRCLGPNREAGYDRSRPLMEMGLDSADLLELSEQVRCEFQVVLGPAFFFEHSTPAKVADYVQAVLARPEADASGARPIAQTRPILSTPIAAPIRATEIAIVGCSCRLPAGINDPESLRLFLKSRGNAVRKIPPERLTWPADITPEAEHVGIDKAAILDDIQSFDAPFFRISPREAATMDPQQRILLELAWACLEDAGYDGTSLSGSPTGVFVGASNSDYHELLSDTSAEAHMSTGTSMAMLANRLSYFFDFRGPSIVIDTACSSSLVAVHQATQSLFLGDCDRALVGGVNLICHPGNSVNYYKAGMLSRRGQCRTFDQGADGYVRAEGAVMMLLKPLGEAVADHDQIYAVIKATSCSHGGQSGGLTVPNPEQQTRMLVDAWKRAGVSPDTLDFLETHGTGTPLGDPIEVQGIRRAFMEFGSGSEASSGNRCGLGALKTNLGHLEAAAGIAGLLKLALALRHAEVLPNRSLEKLNEMIDLSDRSFFIATELQPWPKPVGHPRRGGVSSFGIGGTNAHVVLEEFTGRPEIEQSAARALPFLLSARTPEALQRSARRLLAHLKSGCNQNLESIAYTLQRRATLPMRLALVASSHTELLAKLEEVIAGAPHIEAGMVEGADDLAQLAERWASGQAVDWNAESKDESSAGRQEPCIVPLPTYPFAAQRYWFPHEAGAARARVHALAPNWGQIRPLRAGDWQAERYSNVMVLSTIEPRSAKRLERFISIPRVGDADCTEPLMNAYQTCMERVSRAIRQRRPEHCVILAHEDEDLAWMLDGALRSLSREIGFPASWYSWDEALLLESNALPFSVLSDALDQATDPGHHRLVAVGNDVWCRPCTWVSREDEVTRPTRLRRGGTYWITGGNGGIGRHLAAHLVSEYDAHVVLCGRSALGQSLQSAVDNICASGSAGTVSYHSADCSSRSDMEALYAWTVHTYGELHGVIHAAGLIRDSSLHLRSPQDIRAVLKPKVDGTVVLDEVTSVGPLDFFMTFSSLTAVAGNPGQTDYSAANAFLRAHARRRNRLVNQGARSGATLTIHWPYWREGGMRLHEAQITRLGGIQGTVPMPTSEGLAAFEATFRRDGGETAIVYGPSPMLPSAVRHTQSSVEQPENRAIGPLGFPEVQHHHDVGTVVAGIISEVLAVRIEDLDVQTHLVDYGMDSILLQRVASQLSARFGLALDGLDLHKHPTIELLTASINSRRLLGTSPLPVVTSRPNSQTVAPDDIAIIGVSISVAGATTLEEFERRLLAGEMLVTSYPEARWQALPANLRAGRQRASYRGAFLDDIDAFDARLFGIPPREAMLMDPRHRLALQSVWQAIEDAGYDKSAFAQKKTSVFVALGPDEYATLANYDSELDEFRGRGTRRYMAAHRISHFFDLEGTSETVDTACSSVFVTLERACAMLRSGFSEQAVVTAVQLNLLPTSFEELDRQGLLTGRNRMLPLDQEADGFIRSEGVGTVILKPSRRARADRDHIYALIKGVGIWHAGKTMGLTAPNTSAHRQAMERALALSGVSVNDLSYIEAHGTGMGLGDASEVDAFNEVFRTQGKDTAEPCILSAVKSTLGHLESASGMAALMKAIVALRSGNVPGIAGLRQPRAGLDSGFWSVAAAAQALRVRPQSAKPHAVGLNSYGLGGVSAFVVLEQAPELARQDLVAEEAGEQLFVLSASSPEVLRVYLSRVRHYLDRIVQGEERFDFPAFIATYQYHRQLMRCRLAIVAVSAKALVREIDTVLNGCASSRVFQSGQANSAMNTDSVPSLASSDWDAVARTWVSGAAVPWPATVHERQPFPGYPFDLRSRFWIRCADDAGCNPAGADNVHERNPSAA